MTRSRPPQHRAQKSTPWTDTEIHTLSSLWPTHTIPEIALATSRSPLAVARKAKSLGLVPKPDPPEESTHPFFLAPGHVAVDAFSYSRWKPLLNLSPPEPAKPKPKTRKTSAGWEVV